MHAGFLALHMKKNYLGAYNALWNNPAASPLDIIAMMGTQAAATFARSARLGAYLVAEGFAVPTTIPAGWTCTANADGSLAATAPAGWTAGTPAAPQWCSRGPASASPIPNTVATASAS